MDTYAGVASGGPLHDEHIEATTGKYVYVLPNFTKGFYVFHVRYRVWLWEGYV